ncbi:glycosyltransferase family 2 protein [Flavobacterium sp. ANB]|uniref:glycosyltransferase family 2 protein n=1 Tax=unclassified Flavobacterium TaxID=196869 RepID=UPI0012BA1252|nr:MULTISPECIES: glycosyltransferase family 2 protein [unclassified Flavobacterium]MBF4516566.1 glycosyltransferase family 2 protein [Flavobacterium sp. ANB]MTD69537.1 glycosyltransferase [Flavobacterium sp. LC2016-13]
MEISGLVITYNEERHIAKCIDALFKICDEVIVIDSLSTDNTVKIAEEKGAKVISQAFLGDGPQRIYGLPYCKNDWILNMDADEILAEDAENFILSGKYKNQDFDVYAFSLYNYMNGKVIDFAGWYPDKTSRFFNKKTASPSKDRVHQKVSGKNKTHLKVHIHHYAWEDFDQLICKKNLYSTWHAQQFFDRKKKVNSFKPILNGSVSFVKCYFLKRGFLNGLDGLTFSITQGFFTYMKYAKLLKLQQKSK